LAHDHANTRVDFTGANFRDCDLRQAKITDSWLIDVRVSGLVSNFVVNDVDVTEFVQGELDRRHPERVQLRETRTAGDYRAMWDTIERLWTETVARAERLPEPALRLRVDDEWSFVETPRHLVFATDAWAGRAILDEPLPYHPFGLPYTGYPPADAAALGVDIDARPSLAEVMEVRGNRMALVRGIVDGLADASLERVCQRLAGARVPGTRPRGAGRRRHPALCQSSKNPENYPERSPLTPRRPPSRRIGPPRMRVSLGRRVIPGGGPRRG
jgi:hypothetical protein